MQELEWEHLDNQYKLRNLFDRLKPLARDAGSIAASYCKCCNLIGSLTCMVTMIHEAQGRRTLCQQTTPVPGLLEKFLELNGEHSLLHARQAEIRDDIRALSKQIASWGKLLLGVALAYALLTVLP